MSTTWYRRSTRRPSHDYAGPGAWLITIKSLHGLPSFGLVRDGVMYPNDVGRILHSLWLTVPEHHPNVAPDSFVVMPNHFHALLRLLYSDARIRCETDRRERFGKPVPGSVGTIVRSFKSEATRQVRALLGEPVQLWQPRFDDRSLRDAAAVQRVRTYIAENPARWKQDPPRPRTITYRIVQLPDGCELAVPEELSDGPVAGAAHLRFP